MKYRKIIKMLESGQYTQEEIAKKVGLSRQWISELAKKLNINSRRKGQPLTIYCSICGKPMTYYWETINKKYYKGICRGCFWTIKVRIKMKCVKCGKFFYQSVSNIKKENGILNELCYDCKKEFYDLEYESKKEQK